MIYFEKNVTYVSKTGLEMINPGSKYKQIDTAANGPKNEIKNELPRYNYIQK